MPTTQAEFQQTAADIKTEFADFFKERVFTSLGVYSPSTGQNASTTEIVEAMREDYDQSQIDGQSIKLNDFKLLALVSDFSVIKPTTSGLKVDVDGVSCNVMHAYKDAANAAWIIQVRG